MRRSLLDTDIFSETLKGRHAQVLHAASAYRNVFGRLTVSSITVMEIVKGLHKAGQHERLNLLLQSLPQEEVLSFDVSSGELAGRIHGDLERTGQTIGRIDPMIAGLALAHGLVLVTANLEHFRRVQAFGYPLELANWREP